MSSSTIDAIIFVDEKPRISGSGDTLIHKYDIWEFLQHAHHVFHQLPHRELLKLAIYGITSKTGAPLEIEYIGLCATLESLVLYHRKIHGYETIVDANTWKKLFAPKSKSS